MIIAKEASPKNAAKMRAIIALPLDSWGDHVFFAISNRICLNAGAY